MKRPTHYRPRQKAPTPAAVAFALAFYSRPKPDPLSRDPRPVEPATDPFTTQSQEPTNEPR